MRKRLANVACVISAILLVALLGLRVRSVWRTDVVMMPTGRESVFLFTSHRGGWVEVGLFTQWPGPRARAWTGDDDDGIAVGPFKFWAAHRARSKYGLGLREGQLIVPRDEPGGVVLREGAQTQAVTGRYPGVINLGRVPGLATVRGREINLPLMYPIALAALVPIAWGVGRRLAAVRRRRRLRDGCCVACGYDLRGSPGCCPECGSASVR